MKRDQFNDQYLDLVEKQRLYFKTVKDFKEVRSLIHSNDCFPPNFVKCWCFNVGVIIKERCFSKKDFLFSQECRKNEMLLSKLKKWHLSRGMELGKGQCWLYSFYKTNIPHVETGIPYIDMLTSCFYVVHGLCFLITSVPVRYNCKFSGLTTAIKFSLQKYQLLF